jgi:hypothetical protein
LTAFFLHTHICTCCHESYTSIPSHPPLFSQPTKLG